MFSNGKTTTTTTTTTTIKQDVYHFEFCVGNELDLLSEVKKIAKNSMLDIP